MMQTYTTAGSHTAVIASERALSPSQTGMDKSETPRFVSSVSTYGQNLAPSPPSGAEPRNAPVGVSATELYDGCGLVDVPS